MPKKGGKRITLSATYELKAGSADHEVISQLQHTHYRCKDVHKSVVQLGDHLYLLGPKRFSKSRRDGPLTASESYLPRGLEIRKSTLPGADKGLFATTTLQRDWLIGPFEGEQIGNLDLVTRTDYLITEIDGTVRSQSDPNASNFMRFVNEAPRVENRNVAMERVRNRTFYRTLCKINPNTELLTSYGHRYERNRMDPATGKLTGYAIELSEEEVSAERAAQSLQDVRQLEAEKKRKVTEKENMLRLEVERTNAQRLLSSIQQDIRAEISATDRAKREEDARRQLRNVLEEIKREEKEAEKAARREMDLDRLRLISVEIAACQDRKSDAVADVERLEAVKQRMISRNARDAPKMEQVEVQLKQAIERKRTEEERERGLTKKRNVLSSLQKEQKGHTRRGEQSADARRVRNACGSK